MGGEFRLVSSPAVLALGIEALTDLDRAGPDWELAEFMIQSSTPTLSSSTPHESFDSRLAPASTPHESEPPLAPAATTTAPASFDCSAGFARWQRGWSPSKIKWCCLQENKGCAQLFNCDVGLEEAEFGWSQAKKEWCCSEEGKGCDENVGVESEAQVDVRPEMARSLSQKHYVVDAKGHVWTERSTEPSVDLRPEMARSLNQKRYVVDPKGDIWTEKSRRSSVRVR